MSTLPPFERITNANVARLTQIARFRHRWVTEVAWSPDGSHLAVANATLLALYRFGGTQVALQNLPAHPEPIRTAGFSPDWNWVATGCDDGRVRLWAIGTDLPKHCIILNAGQPVQRVRYSPDGRWVGAVSGQVMHVWETGGDFGMVKTLEGHEGDTTSLAFSADGARVASSSWDRTIRVWDVENGTLMHVLEGHQDRVNQVIFSPDGSLLASAGRDGNVMLWGLVDGRQEASWIAHDTRAVDAVSFSGDGMLLVTGGRDNSARVWSMPDLQERVTLDSHQKPVLSVGLNAEITLLATGSGDNTVRVWAIKEAS